MTDAETIIARVLSEHQPILVGIRDLVRCACGDDSSYTPDAAFDRHLAAEVARALRDAALLPEARTWTIWGVGFKEAGSVGLAFSEQNAREACTSGNATLYRATDAACRCPLNLADHATAWEPAE